jgi:hypothetical protein
LKVHKFHTETYKHYYVKITQETCFAKLEKEGCLNH